MSNLIKLLPDHIANQIAAGEVIQRPASVVKELVENAVDAGATKIEIHIKDAGRTLIQIIDNGSGMSLFDAAMCFERHATSKLHTADDLFKLTTKGFRGEALASIAAIAHVNLKTCQVDDELGTEILVEGSEIKKNEPVVCPVGTNFEIKNLFFNVPARRNFLKSDIVEFKHILNEFHRIVIPHHETHFILTQNGETIHNLPPANLRKRIIDLNGRNYTDRMVPVNESTDIVEINGFVCKPEFAKKSRGEQYLFVNNRFFKDSYFNNAVTRAFENLLQKSTYPGYYIFLTVDPEKIDVNVHPTKTEIKFEEDKFIYSILFSAIKEGLGKFNVMPSLDFEAETSFDVPQSVKSGFAHQPEIKVNSNYNPFTAKPTNSSSSNKSPSPAIRNAGITQQGGDTETTDWKDFYDVQEEKEEKNLEIDLDFTQENKPVLISGSYIMTTVKSGFMSLNYRRAQERIVYDELTSSFISQPIPSQGLLFPYDYEISKEEVLTWEENKKMTKQLGLVWTKNEKGISFTALPSVLQEENLPLFLSDFNEKINFATVEKGEIAHYIILSLAKASSMQSNLVTNKQSADEMIERLFACEDHTYSPSGKAIVKLLKHEQIEKI